MSFSYLSVSMAESVLEIAAFLAGALIAGIGIGWLVNAMIGRRRVETLNEDWQAQVDEVSRERDRRVVEIDKLRTTIEEQQALVHRHEMAVNRGKTELESAREKENRMTKDIFTLKAEREDAKTKILQFQQALHTVQQQTQDLQNEFIKSREFYKGELTKAFEKRKALETKLEDAHAEHESFANLLQNSRSEHDSVNKMLQSAQNRLKHLDDLEHNVIKLEAENAQLNHDARLAKQEIEVLKRDVVELDELRVQNQELSRSIQSMESSRKQYESDALRYREQADRHEQKSETLAIRLDEVEKNFAEIEKQQRKAIKEARKEAHKEASEQPKHNGHDVEERDDLQEIVGIGKVFESALHGLGVYSFKQIAEFGPADIARVNRELKECRGRMEQDDWIGQARELYFKKYGTAVEY
ncbi:MAG: hypothetical protein QNJ00_08125 [Woeseiaceae bacterium]|nr:hypothetical protein [Woeseiaceae bacterium]